MENRTDTNTSASASSPRRSVILVTRNQTPQLCNTSSLPCSHPQAWHTSVIIATWPQKTSRPSQSGKSPPAPLCQPHWVITYVVTSAGYHLQSRQSRGPPWPYLAVPCAMAESPECRSSADLNDVPERAVDYRLNCIKTCILAETLSTSRYDIRILMQWYNDKIARVVGSPRRLSCLQCGVDGTSSRRDALWCNRMARYHKTYLPLASSYSTDV